MVPAAGKVSEVTVVCDRSKQIVRVPRRGRNSFFSIEWVPSHERQWFCLRRLDFPLSPGTHDPRGGLGGSEKKFQFELRITWEHVFYI